MNKTISINPDLFSISSSKRSSRKREKKEKREHNQDIKIKPHKDKNKRLRKQHILRFLRQKQEDNYKKLIEGDDSTKSEPKLLDNTFNSDFDESLKFLKGVTDTNDHKHNFTSKNRHTNETSVSSVLSPIDIKTGPLENDPLSLAKPNILNAPTPSWGCLKNGSLPTFRDWKNSTQKKHCLGTKPEMSAMMKATHKPCGPKLTYKKQKKTVRRTYKVGKSSNISKVAVLISNKTIRNNIMDKTQEIKMKSIEEMKRYLIKRGFIRVGTSAPNDVIQKMYETSNLICGEVENHNADNLLFNYLNDIE